MLVFFLFIANLMFLLPSAFMLESELGAGVSSKAPRATPHEGSARVRPFVPLGAFLGCDRRCGPRGHALHRLGLSEIFRGNFWIHSRIPCLAK